MKDSVSEAFALAKNQLLAVACLVSLILVGSVFLGLNAYFQKASFEVVGSRYASEIVAIQQGNILSSVTKLQRTQDTSAFIKGVLVTDYAHHELVNFGKTQRGDFENDLAIKIEQTSSGLFKIVYGFRAGDLRVLIFTESKELLFLVMIVVLYLLLVVFGFAFYMRKVSLREEKLRGQFEMERMRIENAFNEQIANISRQIAHDIRSPLSVLNIISKKIRDDRPEEGDLLSEASSMIINIADGLLNISRRDQVKEEPQQEAKPSFVDAPMNLVSEIKALALRSVQDKQLEVGQAKKVKIKFYDETSNDFMVHCEMVDLQRIFSNLLNNAIEAIVNEGFVSLTLSENGEGLLIEIRDSGKGMSEELIAKVLKTSTSEGKPNGNGLGLYPSIKKVQSWGSTFEIKSRVAGGTTISIILGK